MWNNLLLYCSFPNCLNMLPYQRIQHNKYTNILNTLISICLQACWLSLSICSETVVKTSLISFDVLYSVFEFAMLRAIAFVLLLTGFSEAWSITCYSTFECSNDYRISCYYGHRCVCPDGYRYFPVCEPQFSCTGNCSEYNQDSVACIPEDFCTAEESVLAFRHCGYTFSARCEYKHVEPWFLRYRRFYVYVILGLIVLYIFKCAFQCMKRSKK